MEHYIGLTQDELNDRLPELTQTTQPNITSDERTTLRQLKTANATLTIKPADKNLGIVVMDTDDYITQCVKILSDETTYRKATSYPTQDIQRALTNTISKFKPTLTTYNKQLYNHLTTSHTHHQTPLFYGIPKIHKQFEKLPPLRPIVSHCNSLLAPSAQLLDHTLQALAQSYPDYIQNSTALSLILEDLQVPDGALLAAIDVASLYPSIPQTKCLSIIYEEMHNRRHLPLNPNLLIQLQHINVNHNYFEFGTNIFQQTKGTAMGAAFSPTIANIFMSITLRHFLRTQQQQPLLLKRYIDDIILIWNDNEERLKHFLTTLNTFHPSLRFTYTYSANSTDFLDLTIYKGPDFIYTNILDTKTFQKLQNLYQYLHFTSSHNKLVHKAIITGECIRYVRTNTTPQNYHSMVTLLKTRLVKRGYTRKCLDNATRTIHYTDRKRHLQLAKPGRPQPRAPLFKCLPPPQYKSLKNIILQHYATLRLQTPRFIALKAQTLRQELVKAKFKPTDEQLIDIVLSTPPPSQQHREAGLLPRLKYTDVQTKPCRHPRCVTCTHLNCNRAFTGTNSRKTYYTRHNFTCTSRNVIYLITCSKCKKQYVGLTTLQLNVRINHHRSNIRNKVKTYISNHFNFEDHTLADLKVQMIDKVTTEENPLQTLQHMEQYWIQTLQTLEPLGLNVSKGIP